MVYFNGERDHNIHGPANKETATQILNEINRTTPKAVSLNTTKTAPVAVTVKDIPVESKDDHDAHGSPSAALEAKVNPATGKVESGKPAAPGPKPAPAAQIKPAAGDSPAPKPAQPAKPVPVPQPVIAQPIPTPAPQPKPQPAPQPAPQP